MGNQRRTRWDTIQAKYTETIGLIALPLVNGEVLKDKYSCLLGLIILLCNNPVTPLIRAPDKWGY